MGPRRSRPGNSPKQITTGARPVGVMLHHAITNEEHLSLVDELLALVADHPKARSTSIYSPPIPTVEHASAERHSTLGDTP